MPQTITITELHENLFNFLIEKQKEVELQRQTDATILPLYFKLRQSNMQNRLKDGYWFYGGGAEKLNFSFWEGSDSDAASVEQPNLHINFQLDMEGNMYIYLNARYNHVVREFFKGSVVPALGRFTRNRNYEGQWQRKYEKEGWEQALKDFINDDKPIIDSLLQSEGVENNTKLGNSLGFISKEVFDKSLSTVEIYRKIRQQFIARQNYNNQINNTQNNENQLVIEPKPYKPLKLQDITIKNIGHFENISLPLDRKVTCLIGENGSGKSTILRAIALGLTGINVFKNVDDDRKSLLRDGDLRRILRIEAFDKDKNEPTFADNGEIELRCTIQNEFVNMVSITLNPQINIVEGEDIYEDIEDDNIENQSFSTLEKRVDEENLIGVTTFPNLVLGFTQGGIVQFEDKEVGEMAGISSPNELLPLIKNYPDNRITKLVRWIEVHYKNNNQQPIHDLFAIISKIVSEGESSEVVKLKNVISFPDKNDPLIIVTTPDAPHGISLLMVSQGYQNIFEYVGRILMKCYSLNETYQKLKLLQYNRTDATKIDGIVLIDELDTYLHPKWQRTILNVLLEQFENMQFVITTHSPNMLANLNPKLYSIGIFHIERESQGELLPYNYNQLNIYAMDITSVLSEGSLFKEPQYPVSPTINKKITAYNNLLERIKNNEGRENPNLFLEAQTLQTELAQDIATQHPVIMRGEMIMNLKRPRN
jgi:predicted ATP-binding protein involved in virulence